MTTDRAALGWSAAGLAAFALLPWYFQQDGVALRLAAGRPWLWIGAVALLLCAVAAWRGPGRLMVGASALGLAALLAAGFALKQPGFGAGGALVLLVLLVLLGRGVARLGFFRGDGFVGAAVVVCAALLLLFVALPVGTSFVGAVLDDAGKVSMPAFAERLFNERVWGLGCLAGGVRCGVAWNTLAVAAVVALGTTGLGTLLALLAERGPKRAARALNVLALLPIITPPFVVGLGLILLFGRAGLVNQFLEWGFGVVPSRWFYGFTGIVLAQLFAFTPIAFMILRGVVQGISPALEEAAQTLRADRLTTFRTVTLPLLKPGLANAFLVGFVESIADFGNPVVVGGSYTVLSTDIFFAIVGAQFDQGKAAALALLLSGFALAVFAAQQRLLARARFTTVTGKGDAGVPMPLPGGVRRLCHAVALPWLAFTLVVYVFAFVGGFVKTWGRDYTPTLAHLLTAFDLQWGAGGVVWAGTAWNSLFTTIRLSAAAAPLCAGLGILIAWLLARTSFAGRRAFEFAALLAFAIPGTVLGVSYVLAFNVPPFELTGTAIVIVLCFVFRSLPVGVRAGAAAFQQIDRSLDEASTMLRAGTATTLRRVVLPLLRPALAAALVYSFVRSMTTVSAVIFLVTAENELATTYIIGRVGNGDYGVALAYCTVLIVLMSVATAAIQALVGERRLGRRAAQEATA